MISATAHDAGEGDMTAETIAAPSAEKAIHPAWVRITHWINAVAMLVMIGSGWEIYNASPLFGFTFPRSITLGGWLAGALLWHFAAMWVLAVNGLIYVMLGPVSYTHLTLPTSDLV